MIPPHPLTIRRKLRVPPIYRPPLGGPLRWQDDQSGVLPAAVMAYVGYRIGEDPEPTAEQLALVIDYLIHYICAPCWNQSAQASLDAGDDSLAAELIQLLDIVEDRVTTCDQIDAWIKRCLAIGIDPL